MAKASRSHSRAGTHTHATAIESVYTCQAGYNAMMRWYAASLAQLRAPCESITVPTRYGQTHLLAAGPADAPPIILLHGMEGTGLSWKCQISALHTSFRAYALDIIGSCGQSAPVRLSHTTAAYSEWLADVLTELRLERASFAGMSSGNWLVIRFATFAPERIEKAVLMGASGLEPIRFPVRLVRYLENEAVYRVVTGITGRMLTRGMIDWALTHFALSRGVHPNPEEVEWFYLLAKYYRYRYPPEPVSDAELRMLAAPTLLMMGEHEFVFDVHAALARARALLPDLRAGEIIPGVGHNMSTDNPDLINARLMRFLQETR